MERQKIENKVSTHSPNRHHRIKCLKRGRSPSRLVPLPTKKPAAPFVPPPLTPPSRPPPGLIPSCVDRTRRPRSAITGLLPPRHYISSHLPISTITVPFRSFGVLCRPSQTYAYRYRRPPRRRNTTVSICRREQVHPSCACACVCVCRIEQPLPDSLRSEHESRATG